MKVVIKSSNANSNWGDASMLHVAIRRGMSLFDDAQITLLEPLPAFERTYDHANVKSLERKKREDWYLQRSVWGPLDEWMPGVIDHLSTRWPRFKNKVTRLKMRLAGHDAGAREAFLRRFNSADALVVSGGGFINDYFDRTAERVLNLVMLAHSREVPVFMFGQGVGPIQSARLWDKAKRALSDVQQIALREKRFSVPLLQKLGVSDGRVAVTGDDSVALAYGQRPASLGSAIGVNLRAAYYSEVTGAVSEELAQGLSSAATTLGAPLLPIPIEYEGENSDVDTICRVLNAAGVETDGGASLQSPGAVIEQVGRCRVVVTGSYHGGVFALSQGIPVVGLYESEYYGQKFEGLADMFGAGCTVLRINQSDFGQAVAEVVGDAWTAAPDLRPHLHDVAEQQVERADVAYKQCADCLAL